MWFCRLSSRGFSCECSSWPPILVVLRSLPKSNKHYFVFFSFVVGVRASRGICCGSFFPFLPQNSTYFHLFTHVEFYNCIMLVLSLVSLHCIMLILSSVSVHCIVLVLSLVSVHCIVLVLSLVSLHCIMLVLSLISVHLQCLVIGICAAVRHLVLLVAMGLVVWTIAPAFRVWTVTASPVNVVSVLKDILAPMADTAPSVAVSKIARHRHVREYMEIAGECLPMVCFIGFVFSKRCATAR